MPVNGAPVARAGRGLDLQPISCRLQTGAPRDNSSRARALQPSKAKRPVTFNRSESKKPALCRRRRLSKQCHCPPTSVTKLSLVVELEAVSRGTNVSRLVNSSTWRKSVPRVYRSCLLNADLDRNAVRTGT